MTREQGSRSWPISRIPPPGPLPPVPLLIEVPALPSSARASGHSPTRPRPRGQVRRRRLRREVRLTAYALLMTSPFLMASLLLWGGRPTPSLAASPSAPDRAEGHARADLAAAPRPPSITITIEPAALLPCAEADTPVVFPGYLLPDDGCEEPPHAGS